MFLNHIALPNPQPLARTQPVREPCLPCWGLKIESNVDMRTERLVGGLYLVGPQEQDATIASEATLAVHIGTASRQTI